MNIESDFFSTVTFSIPAGISLNCMICTYMTIGDLVNPVAVCSRRIQLRFTVAW